MHNDYADDHPVAGSLELASIRNQFELQLPLYERFTRKLTDLLLELLKGLDIPFVFVEGRTKETSSLIENFRRGKFINLEEVYDISALRIVTLYAEHVPKIERVLRTEFDVQREIDTSELFRPDQFGYRSKHFIIKIPSARLALSDWKDFDALLSEIQIRTELEDVWGRTGRQLQHKLEAHIPYQLSRRLSRLSALLELADTELSELQKDWYAFLLAERDRLVHELGSAPSEVSLRRLRNVVERSYSESTYARARRRLRAEIVRSHQDLCSYLEFHFKQRPASIAGKPVELIRRDLGGAELWIPASTIWVGDVQLGRLTAMPIRQSSDWIKSEFTLDQLLLGRELGNLPVFEAREIKIVQTRVAEIEGGVTTYGSALSTQDQLESELLIQASRCFKPGDNKPRFPDLLSSLTRRAVAEDHSRGEILARNKRFNALAVSTLLVVKGVDGEYRVLFQRRSSRTAVHAGLFHVIPAAMFRPGIRLPASSSKSDREAFVRTATFNWDWRMNVLREYGEELFPVTADVSSRDARPTSDLNVHARALQEALNQGTASLEATGLIINLLNLRPEICTLLIVRDATWWAEQAKDLIPNWEYERDPNATQTDNLMEFHLTNVEAEFKTLFGPQSGAWVPSGLAALWLGVDAARRCILEDGR